MNAKTKMKNALLTALGTFLGMLAVVVGIVSLHAMFGWVFIVMPEWLKMACFIGGFFAFIAFVFCMASPGEGEDW